MSKIELEYSYRDKMYNTTHLYVANDEDPTPEFEAYVEQTYLKDVPVEDQPTDFVIESHGTPIDA